MKKILLSMALLSSAALMANAEMYFQFDGEPLANGETLNYEGYEYVPVLDRYGLPTGMYQFKVDPEIHLVSTEDATVSVNSKSNVAVNLCAGGDCVTGTDNTKPEVNLTANTPLNLQMDWLMQGVSFGEDIDVPEVQVKLTATGNSGTITLTVNMGGFTAGVESVAHSAGVISVKGKTLNYDLNGVSKINLYNLTGKTLVDKTVSGTGSISLDTLPAGVYLYRVTGKTKKTGKFIIK